MDEKDNTIQVIAAESIRTRGLSGSTNIDVSVLADNFKRFLQQVERILEQTPAVLGEFRFDQIELQAEISAKGTLALLGTGGEAGAKGGLKFVFKRPSPGKPTT
jgi:hypothetical protein